MADEKDREDNTDDSAQQEALFDMPSQREDTAPSDEETSAGSDDDNVDTANDADSMSQAEKDIAENDVKQSKRKIAIGVGVIVAFVVGAGGAYGYDYLTAQNEADTALEEIAGSTADMKAVNTDVVAYSNGTEDEDYALGAGGSDNAPDSGTFVFGNENDEYERVVDVYIDYANTRSRDFFFANSSMLQGLVESGNAQLRIHAVPSEHPYSAYAAEVLAQVFAKHPDKAWEVNTSLLQLSGEILEMEDPTPRDFIDEIVSELNRYHDITDIDTELIMDAMFSEWVNAAGSSPRLDAGSYPPLVYSDGTLLDTDLYYAPEELRDNIMNASAGDSEDESAQGSDASADSDEDTGNDADSEDVSNNTDTDDAGAGSSPASPDNN